MRGVVIEAFGRPSDVLTLAERPLPEPGPGQVRVRMTMSPIHNHDLAIVRGVYGYKPPLPAVPGTGRWAWSMRSAMACCSPPRAGA